jgi:hypothetical protein
VILFGGMMPVLKRKRKTAADKRFDEQVKRLHVHDDAIAERRWVSVLESLPPNGRSVMITVGHHVTTGVYSDFRLIGRLKKESCGWHWTEGCEYPMPSPPSHWMPYPEPPACKHGLALPSGTCGTVSASTG